MTDDERRELARQRTEAYRERQRRGAVLLRVPVGPREVAALERLALLPVGERDPERMAAAVARFLAAAAPAVVGLGDALYPDPTR